MLLVPTMPECKSVVGTNYAGMQECGWYELYCIVFYYFTWAFPTDPKVLLQGAKDE